MAANILRSEQAVRMSVYVIRAFVRLREVVAANSTILKRLAEIDRTLLQHDAALRDIYHKLLPLLQPAPEPPKRSLEPRWIVVGALVAIVVALVALLVAR